MIMRRWLPESFDVAGHNARVQSQRSRMRQDDNLPRVIGNDAAIVNTDQRSGPPAKSSPGSLRPVVPAAPIYPLVGLCRAAGLPLPIPEYRWHPVRKYRADYALVVQRILIEYDGGLWINGGHSRGNARMHDMEKDRAATMLGWRTLRYAPEQMAQTISDLRIMLVGPEAA